MREIKELKIGVLVVKDLSKHEHDARHRIDVPIEPEPLVYPDREEHKKFFNKLMTAVGKR